MISAYLGQQLEVFVKQLVDSGRYGSKSVVLREGLRLIQNREARLAALDASISRGLTDAGEGRMAAADQVFDRLEAKYADTAACRWATADALVSSPKISLKAIRERSSMATCTNSWPTLIASLARTPVDSMVWEI